MKTYKAPISVKGIVYDEGEIWLRKNQRNEWELPGGKIDEEEQPMETVARELKEELGFDVEPVKIIYAWMYKIENSEDESLGVLVLSYLCRLKKKSGSFETEGEAGKAEFGKFSMDKIEKLNMPDFYKEAIRISWIEHNKRPSQ